jgi:transposase
VVLESTGGLQWRLVRALQEAGYSVSVVNPERIWSYRRLVGRVAKTDRIDARLIAGGPDNSLVRVAKRQEMYR